MSGAQRPGPLLRASVVRRLRGLIKAAPAGFPYPGHGSLALRQAQGERKEIDKGGSRGDAETRRGFTPAAAQPVPSPVDRAAPVAERESACGAARSLRVSASPRAKLPSLDLKAAASAMDARWVKGVMGAPSTAMADLGAPRFPSVLSEALADPCARCEGRWPILRLHPIITACIETPCPMKALLA